jgi:hypothetical protein
MSDNVVSFDCKPKSITRRVRNVHYVVQYHPPTKQWLVEVEVQLSPQYFHSQHSTQAAALADAERYVEMCAK